VLTILGLAAAWFVGWLLLLLSLNLPQQTALQGGLIALLVTMIYLAIIVLPDARNRRLFFDGPEPDEERTLHIGCLWFVPASAFLWAAIIWAGRLLF
jgi:hypothetical protein